MGLEISALCGDFDWVKGFLHADHNRVNNPRVKNCIDLAVDLGVRVVTMHIGHLPADESAPAYQEALRASISLARYAEDRGCVLATETGPESPEALLRFLKKVPGRGIAVNYDPANLVMCGPFDHIGGVKTLRDYIAHTHAKDGLCLGHGKWIETPLGEGGVVFPYWLAALDKVGYDGFLTIEREVGADPVRDIARAMSFLRGFEGRDLPPIPWS
jgi:sugar phosphate isomerase/epimerase